jgi:hypothetical protein
MSKYNYLILVFIFLVYSTNNTFAATSFSKNLPKTKSASKTSSKDKKSSVKDDAEDAEKADDIEKDNPGKNYKLVAIYLIGNKSRVLLKDSSQPDLPAKEYQAGDFLDDAQTITISKINFNPTARIELTDSSGISYLLKPQSTEESKKTGSSTGSLPTYFSAGKNKTTKRAPSTSSPPSPVVPPPPSSAQPNPAQHEAKKDESPKQESSPAKVDASSGQALKTTDSAAPPPADTAMQQAPPPAMTDPDRPANPFE